MSVYLDGIISKQHGSSHTSVVFLDIVKYSKRKSVIQQKVIREFNDVLTKSMEEVSAKHIVESQKQSLNLLTDIIKIPTGDGAAIVFPFISLQSIHLDFALSFLHNSVASRGDITCELFDKNGWCNCHSFFDVRIGVSDGKAIIFKDVNNQYNVAGNTINISNRVMGIAERQQIVFTHESYRNLIDMTEDTRLEDKFALRGKVFVKHDLEIDVCQYVGSGENFLNKEVPYQIQIAQKEAMIGKANPLFARKNIMSPEEKLKALDVMEILKDMPIPEGMASMFGQNSINSVETARAVVEAFKAVDRLMKGSVGGPTIDNSKED